MIGNEQRAYKNMATVNGVYKTTCTTHNQYYNKLTQNFKPAASPPCSIQSNTESSNT